MHIALLGDSVFDNKAYIGDNLDVGMQLQRAAPTGARVTLLAIDGSVVESIFSQLKRLPKDTTHVFINVGGNNVLNYMYMLEESAESFAQVLMRFHDITQNFRQSYRQMLLAVTERKLAAGIFTLFNPRFPDASIQRLTMTGLTAFNDVIIQETIMTGLPLIESRMIFTDPADYANPVEVSPRGGEKMVRAMLKVIHDHNFSHRRTVVYY